MSGMNPQLLGLLAMLYSKFGSIPKPETDGTEGWVEVSDPPTAGDGQEVVWWCPPGWVVRPVKPEGDWSWNQSNQQWLEDVDVEQTTDTTSIDTVTVGTTLA
jgi:hypothetical protein